MPRPESDLLFEENHQQMEWAVDAFAYGGSCLRVLVLSIEQGVAELPIERQAWGNTMAALEWMLTEHVEGRIWREPPYLREDLERVRRVHVLGSEALSGGERAAELGLLAEQCASSLGWDVRSDFPGLPVCYPLPEELEDDPERGTASSP